MFKVANLRTMVMGPTYKCNFLKDNPFKWISEVHCAQVEWIAVGAGSTKQQDLKESCQIHWDVNTLKYRMDCIAVKYKAASQEPSPACSSRHASLYMDHHHHHHHHASLYTDHHGLICHIGLWTQRMLLLSTSYTCLSRHNVMASYASAAPPKNSSPYL